MDAFQQVTARGGVHEGIHGAEALEGIFAVEDPRGIRFPGFGLQNAAPETAVDGRPADEHREGQPAALQLVDDETHLLAGGDQQRTETDGVGVGFDGTVDDGIGGNLLAEVNDLVAVVGEDGFDQVLADVVHVAVNGGQHKSALGNTFFFLQVVFQVRDGFLHHLGGLEHEGQDELTGAEFVADLFHGGQEDAVEHLDGGFVTGEGRGAVDKFVDIDLDAVGQAVQDAVAQALFGGHAEQGGLEVVCLGCFGRAGVFKVLDQALEGICPAGKDQIFSQFALFGGDVGVGGDGSRVDDGHVQTGLHAVIEHDAVDGGAGRRGEAKGDVGHAQRGEHAGQSGLDDADALDGLDG